MKRNLLFISVLVIILLVSLTSAKGKPALQENDTVVQNGNKPIIPPVDMLKKKFTTEFKNDICLPSKLYMLSGVQNDIFVEPLIKRWRPYDDVVRFSGTAKFQRRLQRVASINNPEDGAKVTISLINQDKFDTIKSITSEIVTGKTGEGVIPFMFLSSAIVLQMVLFLKMP